MISPPSRDPANDGKLIGVLKHAFQKFIQDVDDMLPAKVISYDRVTNRAKVQPLIRMVSTTGEILSRAPVASVPVARFGGDNVVLSFNLSAGDLGWIKANDRDISNFKQTYAEASPNTRRKHTFSDAIFIPDMLASVVINPAHTSHALMQTKDGSSCLAFLTENLVLELDSTTKASIPWPRMTQAQRNAIPNPQEGMVVWLLDLHRTSVFNGTLWG